MSETKAASIPVWVLAAFLLVGSIVVGALSGAWNSWEWYASACAFLGASAADRVGQRGAARFLFGMAFAFLIVDFVGWFA